jgi:deoxycytidylate deaminase
MRYHLLNFAIDIAKRESHDLDTQVGAVLLNKDGEMIGYGSNRFDRIEDITPERLVRPEKYKWITHAEVNALRNSNGLQGEELVCTHMPCDKCAQAIADAGVKVVSFPKRPTEGPLVDRWKKYWDAAEAVFNREEVKMIEL